jgi:hypothetical protein
LYVHFGSKKLSDPEKGNIAGFLIVCTVDVGARESLVVGQVKQHALFLPSRWPKSYTLRCDCQMLLGVGQEAESLLVNCTVFKTLMKNDRMVLIVDAGS